MTEDDIIIHDNHTGENMHDDEFPDEHEHWPEEPYNSSFHVTDDEGRHYLLSINLTQEGFILDLYDRYGEENLASWARTYDEVGEMVYEQDPSNINPQGYNPLFDEVLDVLVARRAITREQADSLSRDQYIIDELWEDEIGPMLDRLQENVFSRLTGKAQGAQQFYRIQNIEHGDDMALFWSNELGWTDKIEADTFTQDERNELNLPIGGQWVKA